MTFQQHRGISVLPVNNQRTEYSRGPASKLAITQIVFGGLAFVFGIIATILFDVLFFIGTGIWCGIFFIITGILGILSSKLYQKNCLIITFMILSILSAILAAILFSISIIAIIISTNESPYNPYKYNNNYKVPLLICNILLIIISLSEFIIAIISSAYCCQESCCKQQQYQPVGQYNNQVQTIPFGAPGYYYYNQIQTTQTPPTVWQPQPVQYVTLPGSIFNMSPGILAGHPLPNNQQQVPEISNPHDINTLVPPSSHSYNQSDSQKLIDDEK